MARGIGVGEANAFTRQLVDVRRFIEIAAVAGQIGPAHIVHVNSRRPCTTPSRRFHHRP
jgi:hypothetical protein